MCVNTIVFTSPMRSDSQAATGNENAANTPVQKMIQVLGRLLLYFFEHHFDHPDHPWFRKPWPWNWWHSDNF